MKKANLTKETELRKKANLRKKAELGKKWADLILNPKEVAGFLNAALSNSKY